ncbi:MAG: glycoside hydrolase family 3 C-terminal domain-containing protein [Cytophagales bacterium]|nr:glycoside hydrolase family 3 C-terminal domain-containing protein [Cytophagales bacterium]
MIKLFMFFTAVFALSWSANGQNKNSPFEAAIQRRIDKMSLEEKAGQTAQYTLGVLTKGKNASDISFPVKLDPRKLEAILIKTKAGSILNTASTSPFTREKWQELISRIQEKAMESTGIPLLYGIDAIHGTTYTQGATFFPQQIGQAATFNRELVRQAAEAAAYETRASNIPWNFSPVLDLARNPLWPRCWETFGEDAYLVSEMGKETVAGYQGADKNAIDEKHLGACLKHYFGYGDPKSGKDRTPAYIPLNVLIEKHYEPFVRAVQQGALSVMVNSGIVNGESVHASRSLITERLKEDLNFDGVVLTDWHDIYNLVRRDRIAADRKEAIKIAINAGIDMAMVPYDSKYCTYLVELVKEGKVSEERLNDAVKRVLRMKYRLGLFNKNIFDPKDYVQFASEKNKKLAKKAAGESITLLKNSNNILPLAKGTKVLVAGPNANSMRTLNGGWTYSWQGEKVDKFEKNGLTIVDALRKKLGKNQVIFEPGVSYKMDGRYTEELQPEFSKAKKAAKNADVILAVVGENSYAEKPGDIDDLSLSENQLRLVKELAKTGKPIVLILNEGRPRIISEIEPLADAVLNLYLPGSYGGIALADILTGDVNPSGKLPFTYPKFANSLICYDHKPAENQEKMEGAYDYESVQSVQYAFGYGMSYSTFEYSNLKLTKKTISPDETLHVSIDLTNKGKYEGKEAVLVFTSDEYASITPDSRRLRAFEKICLEPGKTKTVEFDIHPSELAFVDMQGKWVTEKGRFAIQIGTQQARFSISETRCWKTAFRN